MKRAESGLSFQQKLALVVLLLFLASFFFPFYLARANRVSEDITSGLSSLSAMCFLFLMIPPLLIALYAFIPKGWISELTLTLAGILGLFFPLMVLGIVGPDVSATFGPLARYSPASGMYLYLTAVIIIFLMKPKFRLYDAVGMAIVVGSVVIVLSQGSYDRLGIVLEARNLGKRITQEVLAHIRLTFISLAISMVIGIPLALASFQSKRAKKIIFPFLNLLQTIPGIALLGLLITPLSTLSRTFPLLREMGIKGIGNTPAIIALSTYALYPIIRYSFTAFSSIDASVIQAAKGMGMNPLQVWKMVRFPLSAPGVLHGIRVALIQTIGNATLAKLIGGDGLGVLIFEGLGQASVDMVLLGMLLIIALTVASDRAFQVFIHLVTPSPLRAKAVGNG
ncbi:MAG: ABC transporter permease [Sphaerochaeta sp.]|nr:ABC transporter permease [Sphaerochaeta sp.]